MFPFERAFGHFVRVLVDVNLLFELRDNILVERSDFLFFVGIEYEKLPDFCQFCKSFGHLETNCIRKTSKDEKNNTDVVDKQKKSMAPFYIKKSQYE